MHVLLNSRRWQQNILKFKNWFIFLNVHFILVSFTLPLMYLGFFESHCIHLINFQPCIHCREGRRFGFNYYVIYMSQIMGSDNTCTIKYSMHWVGRMWKKKKRSILSALKNSKCVKMFLSKHMNIRSASSSLTWGKNPIETHWGKWDLCLNMNVGLWV